MEEIKKLNCEIENGDNKFNRFEDFISLKNKINLIIRGLNKSKTFTQKEIVSIEIDNFIDFFSSDNEERKSMYEVAKTYMKEHFEEHS